MLDSFTAIASRCSELPAIPHRLARTRPAPAWGRRWL